MRKGSVRRINEGVGRFVGLLNADLSTCLLCSFYFLLIFSSFTLLPDIARTTYYSTVDSARLQKIQELNLSSRPHFRLQIDEEKRKNEEIMEEMEEKWKGKLKVYEIIERMKEDEVFRSQLRAKCLLQSDLFRIEDTDCRAEWLYHLEHGKIVGVEEMLGFVNGKTSAITLFFDDGRKSLFKPCPSPGEFPENEVISSHIDYGMEFNRVAPVISRNISITQLEDLIKFHSSSLHSSIDSSLLILRQLQSTCAINNTLFGSMIGWWRGVENTKTIGKKIEWIEDKPVDFEKIRRDFSPFDLAEITINHFFFYLIGSLQTLGYNEYSLSSSIDGKKLIALDLDRGNWDSPRFPDINTLSSCSFCKILHSDYEKLKSATGKKIGTLVANSLNFDPDHILFSFNQISTLEKRIRNLLNCIDQCVQRYSESDVFLYP